LEIQVGTSSYPGRWMMVSTYLLKGTNCGKSKVISGGSL
jgi:hypothetical protein